MVAKGETIKGERERDRERGGAGKGGAKYGSTFCLAPFLEFINYSKGACKEVLSSIFFSAHRSLFVFPPLSFLEQTLRFSPRYPVVVLSSSISPKAGYIPPSCFQNRCRNEIRHQCRFPKIGICVKIISRSRHSSRRPISQPCNFLHSFPMSISHTPFFVGAVACKRR